MVASAEGEHMEELEGWWGVAVSGGNDGGERRREAFVSGMVYHLQPPELSSLCVALCVAGPGRRCCELMSDQWERERGIVSVVWCSEARSIAMQRGWGA
jgi:hypothetical protein